MPDTPPATPPAPPATPPATPPAAPPATPPAAWHSTLDAETQGWVQNKGWDKLETPDKALPEIIKSFRNTEQYIGLPADQILRMPKDGDEKALGAVYDRLGRPADAAKYDLKLPEGMDAKVFEPLKPVFHKLGLNNQQANGIAGALIEQEKAHTAAQQQAVTQQIQADTAALRTDWGAAYDKNETVVNGVIAKFGMDEKQLVALRNVMGPSAAMKFLHSIGKGMGEDTFVGAEGGNKFGDVKSPSAAKAEIETLKKDADFITKLHSGNAEAKARWDRLHVQMAGGKLA